MKRQAYYVTTPIYYANGRPHIGNTYTTALADALSRFYSFMGCETFFLTGTDEHGDKVAQAARKINKTPYQFTTEVADLFKNAWKELGFSYSRFIRTTDEDHKSVVQSVLQKIYDKGDIYFGEYGGNYCVGCERFLTDKELVDGKCPDHQTVPDFVKETNYFFRMSKYQQQLIEYATKTNPDFIRPERYRNEVLGMLREPLEDLCISRPKERLTWGIELPFDKNYVTYVWFDALINYLSALGYPDGENFKKFWPESEHLIAKDILKPHGVFWPTMLMALDLPIYKHLNVHGYWVTPTGKMSKSLGNVVDPIAIKNKFGVDAYRYFVFREMSFGLDGSFDVDSLENRYNSDLANNLGNLVSRSLAMTHKFRGGLIPQSYVYEEVDEEMRSRALGCIDEVIGYIEKMEIHRAVEHIWSVIGAANVYIDRTKPWNLFKQEKSGEMPKDRLSTVLYVQLEAVRVIASVLSAFMPETSQKILRQLGFNETEISSLQVIAATRNWGMIRPGQKIAPEGSLFPRTDIIVGNIEEKKMAEQATSNPVESIATSGESGIQSQEELIGIDHFAKIQLRVGQVLQAEKIEKSDKLLKLQVDLGEKLGARQIVAGIAKHYSPENIVGRKVVVVANLKPAKLMGNESRGMVLAVSDDLGNLELVSVPPTMPAGSTIK